MPSRPQPLAFRQDSLVCGGIDNQRVDQPCLLVPSRAWDLYILLLLLLHLLLLYLLDLHGPALFLLPQSEGQCRHAPHIPDVSQQFWVPVEQRNELREHILTATSTASDRRQLPLHHNALGGSNKPA